MNDWSFIAKARANQIEHGEDLTFSQLFIPFYRMKKRYFLNKIVLDVGCGTGHLANFISNYSKHITAIDPCYEMIKIARIINRDNNKIEIINAAIGSKLLRNIIYDTIIIHMVIQCVRYFESFIMKLCNNIDINTHVLLTIPHPCFWNELSNWPKKGFYLDTWYQSGSLIIGKSNKYFNVPYYHRPLQKYFNIFYKYGLYTFDVIEHRSIKYGKQEKWSSARFVTFMISRKQ